MKKVGILVLSLVVFVGFYGYSACAATGFYVSPQGNDENPGTQQAPFKTIEKARDIVRNVSMDSDIVVTIMPGRYVLDTALRFEPRDSGRNGHAVIYRAAGDGVVISGAMVVVGWAPDGEKRWKAPAVVRREDTPDATARPLEDTRQLYVDNVRARRARGPFPEGGERYGDLAFVDGDAGYMLPGHGDMASWRNPGEMELGFYNSWSHMICKVDAVSKDGDAAKIALQQPNWFLVARMEGAPAKEPAYIENAFELLDEPGEWYFDKTEKMVYYIPRDGEDMSKARVTVPVVEVIVDIEGSIDAPVHDICFDGITFADAGWLGPNRDGLADVQANFVTETQNLFERDGSVVKLQNEYVKSPGNLRLRGAKAVRFERCTFTRLGGAAIDIERGSQNNTISGCLFHDISGSGIQIGDVLAQDHHPQDERLVVKGNQVANCDIHHVGVEYQDSVGVFAGYTQETVIAHNEIHHLPYSGVSMGWGWGEQDAGGGGYPVVVFRYSTPTPAKDNRVEANHIHHVMLERDDGGGIYTLGNQPGTVIRGNHIHDAVGGPGGIYLDEGSGFIEITGNSVYRVKTPMNYNNRVQDRIKTCNEHDNFFGIEPGAEDFPETVARTAGIEIKK